MAQLFFGPDGTPLSKPEDVIQFLGKRDLHWKSTRSAYQTAHSWFIVMGIPKRIQEILKTDPALGDSVLEKASFEKKTKLDPYGRDSQTDVLAIVKTRSNRAVLGIEAKVDESFGPLVDEWNDYSPGKLRRLAGLIEHLGLDTNQTGSLRYQLLHRTVATLLEATELQVPDAALIVQSFDPNRAGYSDFLAFADAFKTPIAEPGRLSKPRQIGKTSIRLGWTENELILTADQKPGGV